jgi:hypothetical protein
VLVRPAICALAALLLAGCGTKIDGASIERELARAEGDGRFSCPDPDNEVGRRFTCTVTGLEGVTRIEVEVRPREGIRIVGRR